MVAKRPKAKSKSKSVLSKQQIASKRKALAQQRMKTPSTGRRALVGVLLLAASVLALLSVATFDPRDRVGPGFYNAVGPVGHALAELLRGVLGVCAYVLPLGGLYTSLVLFVGARDKRRWPQLVSLFLLILSTSVLAHLVFAGDSSFSHPPGGVVGQQLGDLLAGLFSVVGTVVLVTAVSAAALIVGTQFAFLRLCGALWAGTRVVAARAHESALAFWRVQQAAHAERREKARKAKEEEAAFLAQLEAEEEALAEAEREAQEAEAMAEEALRLTREAEEARKKKLADREAVRADREARRQERLSRRLSAMGPPPPAAAGAAGPGAPALSSGPVADPAWAQGFAPTVPPPSAVSDAEKAKRKTPNIVTPSRPPGAAAELAGPEPLAPAAVAPPEPTPPTPAPAEAAPVAAAAAIVPAPPSALATARTPLIVEPKAPPKPTAKKNQEAFEFVGDRKSFVVPPLDVLECDKAERTQLDKDAFLSTAEKLRAKLADFGIVGEVVEIRPGPVVTMYEFLPGPGIKVSKIASLADDLAMAMEAMRVRIVAPIPGKGVVGIEVPNKDRETVFLKEIAEQDAFQKSSSRLTMCVGKDIEGMPYVLDLAKAPHLLIAGTTGSGKSVSVNAMIMSILLKSTPEEVRFIMVDPKMLELSVYEGIPHLLLPVVTDPKKAALALRWAVEEMERRYQLLADAGVRNIAGYNKLVEAPPEPGKKPATPKAAAAPAKPALIIDVEEGETEEQAAERAARANVPPEEALEAHIRVDEVALQAAEQAAEAEPVPPPEEKEPRKKLPYIVVIIDELADLMMVASREVETYIARLAQMARAAGIHLMVATQRPSTDVVTGVIKANFPTRVSFMLRSKPDSMTILGTVGAEALLGMGDMLIMPPTSAHLQRVHGAFVSEAEIKRAVDHLKAQGKPVYDDNILKPRDEDVEGGGEEDDLSDELYDQALAVVSDMRSVSISMLQRKMRIGYNRAARMIERMERDGVVGPADGAKPREVLIRPLGEMPGAGAM